MYTAVLMHDAEHVKLTPGAIAEVPEAKRSFPGLYLVANLEL